MKRAKKMLGAALAVLTTAEFSGLMSEAHHLRLIAVGNAVRRAKRRERKNKRK